MSEAKAVSKVIAKIKSLWRDLADKESRDEYIAARIDNDLAQQIFSLREQRHWTQGELAVRCGQGNSQGRISKLESSCEGVSVSTLKKLASAFDVGLSIKFVPFSEVVGDIVSERLDRIIPAFPDDRIPQMFLPLSETVSTSRSRTPPIRSAPSGRRWTTVNIASSANTIQESARAS